MAHLRVHPRHALNHRGADGHNATCRAGMNTQLRMAIAAAAHSLSVLHHAPLDIFLTPLLTSTDIFSMNSAFLMGLQCSSSPDQHAASQPPKYVSFLLFVAYFKPSLMALHCHSFVFLSALLMQHSWHDCCSPSDRASAIWITPSSPRPVSLRLRNRRCCCLRMRALNG